MGAQNMSGKSNDPGALKSRQILGLTMAYREVGDGPPIVFLHGKSAKIVRDDSSTSRLRAGQPSDALVFDERLKDHAFATEAGNEVLHR